MKPTHVEKSTGYPVQLLSEDGGLAIYHDGFAKGRMPAEGFHKRHVPMAEWLKPKRTPRGKKAPASTALKNQVTAELQQGSAPASLPTAKDLATRRKKKPARRFSGSGTDYFI